MCLCYTLAVPSYKRASTVETYGERAEDADMLEDGDNDGWVAPAATNRDAGEEAEEIPSSSAEQAHTAHAHPSAHAKAGEDEEDIPDIDDLELEDHEGEEDEVHNAPNVRPVPCSLTSHGC